MVTDLITRLQQLQPTVDLELHTNEPTDAFPLAGIATKLQASGNLGDRLRAALAEGLEGGAPAVLVIGSDSPTVPLEHISDLLFGTTADVALGPASDGGFYAILCRRTHPALFAGVAWSASTTWAEAAEAMRRCGFTVALGSEWYDVDTPADLSTLARDPNLGSATRRALESAAHLLF